MRILGVDYGEKRIGLAVSDELGLTAQGIPTLIRKTKKNDLEIFRQWIRHYSVQKIVVGYPLHIDGSEGIQCEKVSRFARWLAETFLLPVMKWPETLTTKEAEDILRTSGVHWRKRKEKVDQLAACLILQSYLDAGGKCE
ncbi:MAG: Holliday junction resolvase RuvX [Smithella sp.]|nr:Holliday junction resolvase RuvX [Smithella sp.]